MNQITCGLARKFSRVVERFYREKNFHGIENKEFRSGAARAVVMPVGEASRGSL
jgi:hypothetical protein